MANKLTLEAATTASLNLPEKAAHGSQAVHDTVTALRANRRTGSANTKTRSELQKPDKKPWKQKGTGRARSGTVNSPLWCGGAVIFGPKPRSYAKKVNRNTRKLALASALSARVQAGDVIHVGSFQVADGKTGTFVQTLASLTTTDKVLVVAAAFDDATYRSARNHGASQLIVASDVNVEQLVTYKSIIMTTDALPILARRLA